MKRKILLVDDDASLLGTLGDFLESEGYAVSLAESGEAAMEKLSRGTPDLIVLDMSMPGMGGMGVLERIKNPDGSMRFPVLVLTARAMMAEYFADKQVDGFIAKPCDPEDLAQEISRILFQRNNDPVIPEIEPVATVALAEPNKGRHERMRRALEEAGYEVCSVFTGPDLLESVVLSPPGAVVMRLELPGQSADVLVPLLKGMGKTSEIPVIVYGVDAPDANLEHVAALDNRQCIALASDHPASVVAAVRTADERRVQFNS